jgi:hypothetical protein
VNTKQDNELALVEQRMKRHGEAKQKNLTHNQRAGTAVVQLATLRSIAAMILYTEPELKIIAPNTAMLSTLLRNSIQLEIDLLVQRLAGRGTDVGGD